MQVELIVALVLKGSKDKQIPKIILKFIDYLTRFTGT